MLFRSFTKRSPPRPKSAHAPLQKTKNAGSPRCSFSTLADTPCTASPCAVPGEDCALFTAEYCPTRAADPARRTPDAERSIRSNSPRYSGSTLRRLHRNPVPTQASASGRSDATQLAFPPFHAPTPSAAHQRPPPPPFVAGVANRPRSPSRTTPSCSPRPVIPVARGSRRLNSSPLTRNPPRQMPRHCRRCGRTTSG